MECIKPYTVLNSNKNGILQPTLLPTDFRTVVQSGIFVEIEAGDRPLVTAVSQEITIFLNII